MNCRIIFRTPGGFYCRTLLTGQLTYSPLQVVYVAEGQKAVVTVAAFSTITTELRDTEGTTAQGS